jgi:phosphomannomutase
MTAFKAYDIRGRYDSEVNEELAFNVGKAMVTFLDAKTLVVGRDCRTSSPALHDALIKGMTTCGADVIDLGLISTPQLYFALYTDNTIDGGVMITASHNPKEYNGLKLCAKKAIPLFSKYGFDEIKQIIATKTYKKSEREGEVNFKDIAKSYIQFMKAKAQPLNRSFKLLIDCGNGMGTKEVVALKQLYGDKLDITTLYENMDGNFPNHEANPIIPDNMHVLSEKMKSGEFDYGIAFDGDADRVAFYLDTGEMVGPDLLTGLLGSHIASGDKKVGYEVRSSQAVEEILIDHHIVPLLYPSGRAFMMAKMREDKAMFAGEKSGHYFYKELYYTDSALFTIMQVLSLVDKKASTLNALIEPLEEMYSRSGELNYTVKDADAALKKIEETYMSKAQKLLKIDGISVYTEGYFFNVRKSNTEPLLRINIEGTGPQVVEEIREQLEMLIH